MASVRGHRAGPRRHGGAGIIQPTLWQAERRSGPPARPEQLLATWSPPPARTKVQLGTRAPEQRAQQQLGRQRLRGRRARVPRPQPGVRGLGLPRPTGRLRQRGRRSTPGGTVAHPRAGAGGRRRRATPPPTRECVTTGVNEFSYPTPHRHARRLGSHLHLAAARHRARPARPIATETLMNPHPQRQPDHRRPHAVRHGRCRSTSKPAGGIRDSSPQHDLDGVFVAGTTGEFTTLSDDERLDVCAAAAEAFGPERTYWHVGAASLHQAALLTEAAVDRGARRLAALTPHYFPATESAVLAYYETVVRRGRGRARLRLPLRCPRHDGRCRPSCSRSVAETGIAGVKISGEPHAEVRSATSRPWARTPHRCTPVPTGSSWRSSPPEAPVSSRASPRRSPSRSSTCATPCGPVTTTALQTARERARRAIEVDGRRKPRPPQGGARTARHRGEHPAGAAGPDHPGRASRPRGRRRRPAVSVTTSIRHRLSHRPSETKTAGEI